MIKRVAAYVDSEGVFYPSRVDAMRAEFRRMLREKFAAVIRLDDQLGAGLDGETISINDLVAGLQDLDQIVGEAQKEDTRVDFAPADGSVSSGT